MGRGDGVEGGRERKEEGKRGRGERNIVETQEEPSYKCQLSLQNGWRKYECLFLVKLVKSLSEA